MLIDSQNTLSSALAGLQVGVKNARNAADEVAKLTTASDSVREAVKPLLDLHQAEAEVSVGTQLVKAQDESLGRLIDEMA